MRPTSSETQPEPGRSSAVLAVGTERPDEFKGMMRLARDGYRVIVVNPRETAAARRFAAYGGAFVHGTIEELPAILGPFDLILENYPYTVGFLTGVCEEEPCPIWESPRAVREYAAARLELLAPGGRWILWTESPGLARAFRRLASSDLPFLNGFSGQILAWTSGEAPRSAYPRLQSRFQVVFRRFRKTRSAPKRSVISTVLV
jgi:hypothetical protein